MATTVENPFDTQQSNATNQTPAQQPSSAGLVASALPQPNQAMTYTAETRQVNQPTETVQGQVDSILAKDSPLMQRARTLATQQMAQRGLVNSSMSQGAGVAAMIDRALPMAQQDANTYSSVSSENMAARNRAAEANAGLINQFSLQKGAQEFQAGQSQLDRAQQTNLQSNQQQFQAGQASLDRAQQTNLQASQQEFQASQQQLQNDFNMRVQQLQESGQDFRQARDIASREAMQRLSEMGVTNRFDQELALKSSQFNIEQYNLDKRQLIANQNELDKLGLQIKANTAQIPTQFAANISNTAMNGVNAVMADGNLSGTPDGQQPPGSSPKSRAIDNIVNYANSQISWAEKFYGTTIPAITTPGAPPNFDAAAYLAKNPDVARAGVDPLQHYIQFGRSEGRTW